MRRRWLGGIVLSSRPCGAPPCRTPTRFIASNYDVSANVNGSTADNITYIVRSIAVIVNSTEKGSGGISANMLHQKMPASGMFIKEVGYIMNETSNANQRTRLGLRLVYTPRVSEKTRVPMLETHSSPS